MDANTLRTRKSRAHKREALAASGIDSATLHGSVEAVLRALQEARANGWEPAAIILADAEAREAALPSPEVAVLYALSFWIRGAS